ncbi:MAG: hypothetical protein WBO55_08320 [Rhizobiaceae bacterium]
MRVPLTAVWPPLALVFADIMVMVPAVYYGIHVITAALALGLLILAFDIRGRRMDFRNAHRHFTMGRDPARVAKSYQFSWCSRVACESAAWSAGKESGEAVSDYYLGNGYRWFHIFPDRTFSRDCPFITVRFWEVTLRGNARARSKLEAEFAAEDSGSGESTCEPQTIRRAA